MKGSELRDLLDARLLEVETNPEAGITWEELKVRLLRGDREGDEEATDDDSDRVQIIQRLSWTPKQRLDHLVDMVAFEERAHRARRLG